MLKFIRSILFIFFYILLGITISALGIVELNFATAFELFILLLLLFSGWIAKVIFDWIMGKYNEKRQDKEFFQLLELKKEAKDYLDKCLMLANFMLSQKNDISQIQRDEFDSSDSDIDI